MRLIMIKLALEMIRIIFFIVAFFLFHWGIYSYVQSDAGLLSDEALIAIISNDVLGHPAYGKSCPRSSYIRAVESQLGGDKGTGYFVFKPVEGQRKHCPPIAIITDRNTGEAWIADR